MSFKVTPSNESSLFVPLQGIAPQSSWLEDAFLKEYTIICKIKMREMKKKLFADLNCTMDIIDRNGENKTQRLYRCYFNYSLSKLFTTTFL